MLQYPALGNAFVNGKMYEGCAYKNKALVTLVSYEIWRDISLAISRVISLIYSTLNYAISIWAIPIKFPVSHSKISKKNDACAGAINIARDLKCADSLRLHFVDPSAI